MYIEIDILFVLPDLFRPSFASGARWSFVNLFFFFSSRRRHTRLQGDWSSDVCSSDLLLEPTQHLRGFRLRESQSPHGADLGLLLRPVNISAVAVELAVKCFFGRD